MIIFKDDVDGFFDRIGSLYINDATDFDKDTAVFSIELMYQAFKKRLLEETEKPATKPKKKPRKKNRNK